MSLLIISDLGFFFFLLLINAKMFKFLTNKYGTISLHPFIHYYLSVIRQEDEHSLVIRNNRRERKRIHLEIITDD